MGGQSKQIWGGQLKKHPVYVDVMCNCSILTTRVASNIGAVFLKRKRERGRLG